MRSGTDAYGWVCITKTRACNAPFYRWFCEEVVCPFVSLCRDGTHFEDEDSPRFAFVACDGEPRQIEIFQEPTMLGLPDESKILLVKTPASCSAICQPSDVSASFKASKKKLAYLPRDTRGSKQWKIDGALQDDEDDFEEQVKILHANKAVRMKILTVLQHTAFSPEKKTKVVDAIQRIAWAIRETLRESIKDNFKNMASIFRLTGALTEAQMDEASIPSLGHLQHQQRAVVLNSPRCIGEYRAYKQRQAQELETQRRAEFADYKARLFVTRDGFLPYRRKNGQRKKESSTEERRGASGTFFRRGKGRAKWPALGCNKHRGSRVRYNILYDLK